MEYTISLDKAIETLNKALQILDTINDNSSIEIIKDIIKNSIEPLKDKKLEFLQCILQEQIEDFTLIQNYQYYKNDAETIVREKNILKIINEIKNI